tara:strand:+ start:10282 stop:10644 length:363 start_codon:yes stop_codon:yes gene_type:complete
MISSDLIKDFFEDQFGKYGPGFSYVDHQLLKANKFEEFFDLLLARTRKQFIYGSPIAIAIIIIGLTSFWLNSNPFDIANIILPIYCILIGGLFQYWISKQYFIIKSSNWLIKKMLTETEP